MKKVWEGRFKKELDPLAQKFNASINFDKRLFKYDIMSGIAHAKALLKAKIITKKESDLIINGLKKLLKMEKYIKWENYEDVHSAVEIELTKIIGDTGKKLHTARSRNDLIVTDEILYLKDEIKIIKKLLLDFLKTLLDQAEKNLNIFLPGYTHLQQAQIITVSYWLLSYFQKFKRDYEFLKTVEKNVDILPLGSGAIAGTNYPIDRKYIANLLGFKEVSENSMDSVSNRDFILDFLYFTLRLAINFSRLCEDIIIYSSNEFGFIEIDDSFATGSSIMPNKKNPDIAELIRGKSARFLGYLVSLVTMLKGLPSSYNKDMQEDKIPLFNAVDEIKEILNIAEKFLRNIYFNTEEILNKIQKSFMWAVDIADFLVKKGLPFRDAHKITGKLVLYCLQNKKNLNSINENEIKNISKYLDIDILKNLDPQKSIDLKISYGSTSKKSIQIQIRNAKKFLKNET